MSDEKKCPEWHREMFRAMRTLLGGGYVPSYYEEMASEFIAIADQTINEAVTAERTACAEVADTFPNKYVGGPSQWTRTLARRIADAIRARSK